MAASNWYDSGVTQALTALDFAADTVKVMIMKSTYTPDLAAEAVVDDIVASEADFTNYARKTLGTKSVAVSSHKARAKAAAVTWTSAGGASNNTVNAIVVFKFVSDDTDSPLLAYIPVAEVTTDGTDLTFTPDATNGLITIQGS